MTKKKTEDEKIGFAIFKITKKISRYHADVNIHLDDDEMKKALITALTDTAHKLLESMGKNTEEKEEKK